MEKEELKENLKSGSQWLRFLYMVLCIIFFEVAALLGFGLVIFQFLHTLVLGRSNEQLLKFGDSLGQYFRQLVAFLTYNTEERPFPFADWPKSNAKPAAKKVEPKKETDEKMGGREG